MEGYQAIITPIDIAGERLGTLFIYKQGSTYSIDDIILSEYGTAVVGLEMLRSVNEENAEETRKEHIVQSAISTLSFSELEAIMHIFDELGGTEGILDVYKRQGKDRDQKFGVRISGETYGNQFITGYSEKERGLF